jgi:hypothetical protein
VSFLGPSRHGLTAGKVNIQDADAIFNSFAVTCLANGSDCALKVFNFSTPSALLHKIDDTIDSLYNDAVPVFGVGHPAAVTAGVLRTALSQLLYATAQWPQTAAWLADAFKGNYTGLVSAYGPWINPSDAKKPDNGANVLFPIFVCIIYSCLFVLFADQLMTASFTVRRLQAIFYISSGP